MKKGMTLGNVNMGNLTPVLVLYTEQHQSELLLRGLPFSATIPEITLFLLSLGHLAQESDVKLCADKRNKFNGRAIVQCKSTDDALRSQCAVHGAMYEHRYIEAFMRSRTLRSWDSNSTNDSQFGPFGKTL